MRTDNGGFAAAGIFRTDVTHTHVLDQLRGDIGEANRGELIDDFAWVTHVYTEPYMHHTFPFLRIKRNPGKSV